MLEWLAAATSLKLGELVLTQVLDLSQTVLESYVQDFFRDCLDQNIARLKAASLKVPMAEAIGFFIKRFIKELQLNDVPDTSIDHHYSPAIKRFVKDQAVLPVLGKAFEKDCKQIDYGQLEAIWTQQYQPIGCQFPTEDFDWRRLAKEYVVEVRAIVKADEGLRSLLETELLQDIARNTAQVSPGFDVDKYRDSLQSSYGYLKLSTLDTTDQYYQIKLWQMFIEQTVREALPPSRYELPLDVRRQLQEQGQLENDLSSEALERYRSEYFQQPARKVLEVIAEARQAVILGDPGSGKSSLLQYLALEWVESKRNTLPILIELREYVLAQCTSFLDFLQRGQGADWQFDQHQLHQWLLEEPTLIMFDGLDEVFNRSNQGAIIDDIIRFAQQYPRAQVLVTSRIIGYNPDRFQYAGFRQFTIQTLDNTEIHDFINRWYDLSMGGDPDKERLKQRLKDAIANSKAIQNLADNPLMLTMMSILNRRQELPRDRADLYDQASRVLLYHWDVDHKRLQIPTDAIGRREKQEMLRLIAYEMQSGEGGLKGNLISSEQLTRVLKGYLQNECFSQPRETASLLIQQLRERNYILCYRGADTYGFVHRTFLEYFCALEIKNQFETQQTLSFDKLRDEVFGKHWQDESWHEVLRLICGMIDAKFAEQLIYFLMDQKVDRNKCFDERWLESTGEERLKPEALINILLATDCFFEIHGSKSKLQVELLSLLKREVEDSEFRLIGITAKELLKRIANCFEDEETISWLRSLINKENQSSVVQYAAVLTLAEKYSKSIDIFDWLRQLVLNSGDWGKRQGAIESIIKNYIDNPVVFDTLKNRLENDEDWGVKKVTIKAIEQYFSNEAGVLELLLQVADNDPFIRTGPWEYNTRQAALEALMNLYPAHPRTQKVLKKAMSDPDEQLRDWALQQWNKNEI